MYGGPRRLQPVSYTHLDVYKRQAHEDAGQDEELRQQRFGRVQELREQRGEEQDGLGIQAGHEGGFEVQGQRAGRRAALAVRRRRGHAAAAQQVAQAQVDQVGGAGDLEDGEQQGGLLQHHAQAQHGGCLLYTSRCV